MKKGWKEYRLDEVYSFSSGLSKGKEFFGKGYGFVSFKDVYNNTFLPQELNSKVQSTPKEQSSCSVIEGDVFLTRTSEVDDELGISSVALKTYPKATFNGFSKRLRPNKGIEVNPYFAGYYFRSPLFRSEVAAMSSLITRASLNNGMLSKLTILLPPQKIQNKIGELLYHYDNLIEVNNKRIELLEQSARELYKEWFVRMRFPNYQNTKFNKGIPEGWEVKGPFEIADIMYGFPFNSKLFNEEGKGVPIIRIRDIQQNLKNTFTTEDANIRYLLEDGDILIGMDGEFYVQRWMNGRAYVNQRVLRLRYIPDSVYCSSFIENVIREPIFFLNSIIVGTTVAHLSDRDMKKMQLLIPNNDLLLKYKEIAEPVTNKIILLFKQNQELTEIRNRLLPRLISGKLEIKA